MAVKNRGKTDLMRRSRRGPGTSLPATPSFSDTSFSKSSKSMAGVDAPSPSVSVTAPTADTVQTTDFGFAGTDFGLSEAAARRRFNEQTLASQLRLADVGQQTQRGLRDVSERYARAAPGQITGFTGRGLGRSGLFQEAMQQFAGAQQSELADLAQTQQAAQVAEELRQQQAAQDLQDELDRLELARQQQILSDAAALQEFAPIVGLFS